jgi:hypothetical protein
MDYPTQLDERFTVRASLECGGAGGLLHAERDGLVLAVRWFPHGAAGEEALAGLAALPLHPSLPRLACTGVERSCTWAAFELVDGEPLDPCLALPPGRLAQLGEAIAGALAALHAAGLVHGELASQSVLLPRRGLPLLADIAPVVMARSLGQGGFGPKAVLGRAVPYLSPERARGGAVTREADVYALGALLCAAGGGGAPVVGSPFELQQRIARGLHRVQVPLALPETLRAVLARMIDPQPGERPTAAEAAIALEEWRTPRRPAADAPRAAAVPAPTQEPLLDAHSRPTLVNIVPVIPLEVVVLPEVMAPGAPEVLSAPFPEEVLAPLALEVVPHAIPEVMSAAAREVLSAPLSEVMSAAAREVLSAPLSEVMSAAAREVLSAPLSEAMSAAAREVLSPLALELAAPAPLGLEGVAQAPPEVTAAAACEVLSSVPEGVAPLALEAVVPQALPEEGVGPAALEGTLSAALPEPVMSREVADTVASLAAPEVVASVAAPSEAMVTPALPFAAEPRVGTRKAELGAAVAEVEPPFLRTRSPTRRRNVQAAVMIGTAAACLVALWLSTRIAFAVTPPGSPQPPRHPVAQPAQPASASRVAEAMPAEPTTRAVQLAAVAPALQKAAPEPVEQAKLSRRVSPHKHLAPKHLAPSNELETPPVPAVAAPANPVEARPASRPEASDGTDEPLKRPAFE